MALLAPREMLNSGMFLILSSPVHSISSVISVSISLISSACSAAADGLIFYSSGGASTGAAGTAGSVACGVKSELASTGACSSSLAGMCDSTDSAGWAGMEASTDFVSSAGAATGGSGGGVASSDAAGSDSSTD
jgi:hypothetical protein